MRSFEDRYQHFGIILCLFPEDRGIAYIRNTGTHNKLHNITEDCNHRPYEEPVTVIF
jgi:hypothetical protein